MSPPKGLKSDDWSVRHRPEAEAALAYLHHVFTGSGIDIPNVPLHLLDELQIHPPVEGPVWTTDFELQEPALYYLHLDFSTLLSPTRSDFWMFGLARGAFGLHTKIGPIMILQQNFYNNGYSASLKIRGCRNGIRAWNTSLVTLKTFATDVPVSPRFLIRFSDFRGDQEIWELDTLDDTAPDGPAGGGIPGRNIYSGIGDSSDPVLGALKDSNDPVLAAAAQHLGRLIQGQEDAELHQQ